MRKVNGETKKERVKSRRPSRRIISLRLARLLRTGCEVGGVAVQAQSTGRAGELTTTPISANRAAVFADRVQGIIYERVFGFESCNITALRSSMARARPAAQCSGGTALNTSVESSHGARRERRRAGGGRSSSALAQVEEEDPLGCVALCTTGRLSPSPCLIEPLTSLHVCMQLAQKTHPPTGISTATLGWTCAWRFPNVSIC